MINTTDALRYLNNYLDIKLTARSVVKFNYDNEFNKLGYKVVCFSPFKFDFVTIEKNDINYTAILHTDNKMIYSFDFNGTVAEAVKNMKDKFNEV